MAKCKYVFSIKFTLYLCHQIMKFSVVVFHRNVDNHLQAYMTSTKKSTINIFTTLRVQFSDEFSVILYSQVYMQLLTCIYYRKTSLTTKYCVQSS